MKWFEELLILSNPHCPYCGQRFQVGDEVDLIATMDLGEIVIAIHQECLRNAIESIT